MVAAPVRAHDARDEMRERALDERRVVDELEARLVRVVGGAAREVIREARSAGLEDVDAEPHALVQEAPILRGGRRRRARAAGGARPT